MPTEIENCLVTLWGEMSVFIIYLCINSLIWSVAFEKPVSFMNGCFEERDCVCSKLKLELESYTESCEGWDEDGPHRLRDLNTWYQLV